MEKTIGFGIGFLITLMSCLFFIWLGRHILGFDESGILFGIVTLACIGGGREFNKS